MLKKKEPNRISKSILTAIRNRPGYRPLNANITGGDIVIASYNVHKCIGIDKQFNPQRTTEVISEIDADVIALQEADRRFGERSGLLDLGLLERRHGLIPVPITSTMPKGHGWHGNVLLFREGVVRNVQQLKLPGVEPRGALVADLQFPAGPLRVIAAHLGLLKRSREQQAESILTALQEADTLPTLLIGDLNEWRIGKRSSLAALMPTFNHVATAVPSFPSRFPVLPWIACWVRRTIWLHRLKSTTRRWRAWHPIICPSRHISISNRQQTCLKNTARKYSRAELDSFRDKANQAK